MTGCPQPLLPPSLIGIPYDAASSHLRGAALAPPRIRQALHSPAGNLWTEGLEDLTGLQDAGDLALPGDGAAARAAIERGIADLLDRASPIALGGDHSITYPILRAIHGRYPAPTIVQLDAHPDLYPEFAGDRYSHACPFARILEEGLAGRLVQVGLRAMTGIGAEQAERFGVELIDMRAWARGHRPVLAPGETWYLSLDLDGLDPGYAPAVSHPEPGGLTTREAIGLIQDLGGVLIGADVVELNPTLEGAELTAGVAAKLVKEVAGRMSRQAH
jgi:agmatinase